MFKFLTKQFIYGRIYLWIKDRLGAILFLSISIFLIIYFHNEYLKYIEYKEKFASPYIAAERGYIDRVIFPRDTRKELIIALERYGSKREERPKRKHGNIPL